MIILNWGILGAGNISSQFVNDLILNNKRETEYKHVIRSIGCSSIEKGEKFINFDSDSNYGVTPIVETYDNFYKNDNIDVVYIGTPHTFHKEQVINCLNNNKHVLCEKPFTVNKSDAEELLRLAKEKKLFIMEAVWTRFFPAIAELKKKIAEGAIGKPYRLFADLSYNANVESLPTYSRVRDRRLAAGALLDIGIYPITYSRILLDDKLGKDHTKFDVKSFLTIDETDQVDHLGSIIIKYQDGKHAVLTSSELINGPSAYVRLEGSKGHIEMYSDNPAAARHFKIFDINGKEIYEFKDDSGYKGFIYEANSVADDIANGRLENSIIPQDETLLVMDILDHIRKENNLVYDQDK
ncbi:unnamed protein product [Candida verbasci]|uniref:D-xylose 1-dehydrogenase (NADP(+), D-xylono-1,5-lactone-forming) n=1 Tax=Candida verbasci TaxID=1227364 RepID=A0A9W4XJT1_9ASCO|nr:unnamed protein product [Candida verbasci]